MKIHVKTGDTVMVISGKHGKDGDVGKTGKVVAVSPKEGKVIVEGINMVSKHVKPRRMGETGGIVKAEAPIYACKVQIYCPKCKKPVRTGIKVDGDQKIRVCKKCGEEIK